MKTLFLSLLLLFSVSAFADPGSPMNDKDPYESYNRAVFAFNMEFNDAVGMPVANAYQNYVPSPARKGISNFFQNLKEPLNVVNALFQGKPKEALSSFMRFSINSTLGLAGLLDIATPAKLKYQQEDLGQTLYKWGVWDKSSFIMLPILGPYTTRELVGGSIDSVYNPTYPYVIQTDLSGRALLFVGSKFVDYTKVVNLTGEMKSQPDPYIFMRESYMQYRTNLIYDGNPPQPKLDDFDFN
ncbi:MAG: VacJ family lipoprotein [Thiotrichales bacterium]|nr:VacJ family lipoprotein [Thiotrichales bacterium]